MLRSGWSIRRRSTAKSAIIFCSAAADLFPHRRVNCKLCLCSVFLLLWVNDLGRNHDVVGSRLAEPAEPLAAKSVLPIVVGLMLAVAVADYFSGERYTVYVLYFPIVAISCWLLGLRWRWCCRSLAPFCGLSTTSLHHRNRFRIWRSTGRRSRGFWCSPDFLTSCRLPHPAMKREYHLSHFDELTGLANRTSLFENGQRNVSRCRRTERPLTAVFVDLDHFKLVNDRSGHAVGDFVLRAVANAILECTRDTDLTARIGGDEFVIIAPEMSYSMPSITPSGCRSNFARRCSAAAGR